MAKIATITSGVQATGIKIESPLQRLELKITGTKADGTIDYDAFIELIKTLKIEITKSTKNGSQSVLQRMSVMKCFELAQSNGGLILGNNSANTNTIEHCIELSDYGSIPLADGESFELNFFDYPVAASTTYTIDVHAVDSEGLSNIHNVYEAAYFNANSAREIDVRDVKSVAVPVDSFEKMELLFRNGRRVMYTKDEVLAQMRDALGLRSAVFVDLAEKFTQINSLQTEVIYNVATALTAKITCSAGTNVILLKHKQIS